MEGENPVNIFLRLNNNKVPSGSILMRSARSLGGRLETGSARQEINYHLAARQTYVAYGGIVENKYSFKQ